MRGRVAVLGAAGRFGFVAAEAFRANGWMVTSVVRPGAGGRAPRGTEIIEARVLDGDGLVAAVHGADVVLHALNPPYTDWERLALPLAHAAIEAAEATGATLMLPGNVYNLGADVPPTLDEATPMHPTSRKGVLRVAIEGRMQEAAERGVRTIILRAGDFFGGGRGSWFDLVVARDLANGIVTYPGPLEVMHEWAYLPDLAAAMVRLAEVRERLDSHFEVFGFPGHGVTGREFVAAIVKAMRRDLKVRPMTWWLIHLLRPFLPLCRELSEMAYLWKRPHRIDGSKLEGAIGKAPQTPLNEAVARSLRDLGFRA